MHVIDAESQGSTKQRNAASILSKGRSSTLPLQ
jgi:hypothetical protein